VRSFEAVFRGADGFAERVFRLLPVPRLRARVLFPEALRLLPEARLSLRPFGLERPFPALRVPTPLLRPLLLARPFAVERRVADFVPDLP
jgi:hypothetical protein